MKEVKHKELEMFLDFAPQYFDYLCKSFFHDYPCTLAKIVGVYKINVSLIQEKVNFPSLSQPLGIAAAALPQNDKAHHPLASPSLTDHPYLHNKESKDIEQYQDILRQIIDPDDEAEYLQSCAHSVPDKHHSKVTLKTFKKYVFVSENLNYGLTPEDEKHLIRYDLKGSTANRFV